MKSAMLKVLADPDGILPTIIPMAGDAENEVKHKSVGAVERQSQARASKNLKDQQGKRRAGALKLKDDVVADAFTMTLALSAGSAFADYGGG